jgi:hypothetical protein
MNTIAAEFEDCMETYQSLCSAMEANAAAWPGKMAVMCECRKALLHWGYRTGAATRALDYALHKNSDLQDEVLELLEGFKATLQSSKSFPTFIHSMKMFVAVFLRLYLQR